MNEFTVRLDLAKAKQRQQQTIFVRQGDQNGTTIVATITDHGVAASTSGLTARFQMRLPDGTHYYRKVATLSGNVATVTLDEAQAASAVGRTDVAYFQLLQGSTVVASTESFTVIVLPDALADADVPESYDSAIQDAIDALDAAVEQMPDMVEDVLADHPEWTTTVQDGSITKAKLATDLARDRERLLYRLDNLLTNALPEGETATASDAAKTPVAGLALYGRSTQAGTPTPSAPVPVVSVAPDSQGNISLWARGRNLLSSGTTKTVSGITYTVNADGSVNASGTASARSDFQFVTSLPLAAGTYTLSGAPQGGAGKWNLRLDRMSNNSNVALTEGNPTTFTLTEETSVYADIRVYNGQTVNITFYPQLEMGSTATAYQPYEQTVTPIPLDGHELRSLPDGTRDEVTVDERGHAVLVQRVGTYTVTASSAYADGGAVGSTHRRINLTLTQADRSAPNVQSLCTYLPWAFDTSATNHFFISNAVSISAIVAASSAADALAALVGAEFVYPLMNPVTIDLGYVAAVPLCGPDLTAQAIPTAPFALTYERDLNTTLARLESAIATLA